MRWNAAGREAVRAHTAKGARTVTGAQLAGDAGQMRLHGESREPHRDADRLVGLALRNQPQHLDLASGQFTLAARVARTSGTTARAAVHTRGGSADGRGPVPCRHGAEIVAGAGDDVALDASGEGVPYGADVVGG
jgi:hypothetical protein